MRGTAPRKCWIAASNCLRREHSRRRQVDESRLAYVQAQGQYQAAEEHLKTLQGVGKEEQSKTAAAQVQTAKAHYESQEAQVAYSRVVSPIAGVVADRPLNEGDIAAPGMPLMNIMDISRVVARVNVPQGDAPFVKVGQTAMITQADNTEPIEGKVTVVSPSTDPNTTTVQVWVEIENTGESVKPGTTVHASIVTEQHKAASVVPAAAILPGEEGGTAVLTVTPDSIAHTRAVKLGIREGNQVADSQRRQSRRRGGGRGGAGCGRQNQSEGGHNRSGRIRRR